MVDLGLEAPAEADLRGADGLELVVRGRALGVAWRRGGLDALADPLDDPLLRRVRLPELLRGLGVGLTLSGNLRRGVLTSSLATRRFCSFTFCRRGVALLVPELVVVVVLRRGVPLFLPELAVDPVVVALRRGVELAGAAAVPPSRVPPLATGLRLTGLPEVVVLRPGTPLLRGFTAGEPDDPTVLRPWMPPPFGCECRTTP